MIAGQVPSDVHGPIFIGGLDRSGKTTLQAFLTSHPRIAIPDVGSNMWTYFYRRFGDLSRPENLERCLDAMLSYSHITYLAPDPQRIRREFRRGPSTYARLFSLFLIHFAERANKPRWGAQTGLIERYAEDIFRSHEQARVIHMVRDPRDRYEAAHALWPTGRGRAGGAVARWTYSLSLARRHLRRHPDGYMVVRFEDLVGDPEGTLRAVCAFVGEPFVPEMLEMAGAPERRAKLASRRTGPGAAGLLSSDFIGRYKGRVPAPELAFIQIHAGRRMRELGYHADALGMSGLEWASFVALDWPSQVSRMLAWRGLEFVQQRAPRLAPRRPDPRTLVAVDPGAAR